MSGDLVCDDAGIVDEAWDELVVYYKRAFFDYRTVNFLPAVEDRQWRWMALLITRANHTAWGTIRVLTKTHKKSKV